MSAAAGAPPPVQSQYTPRGTYEKLSSSIGELDAYTVGEAGRNGIVLAVDIFTGKGAECKQCRLLGMGMQGALKRSELSLASGVSRCGGPCTSCT